MSIAVIGDCLIDIIVPLQEGSKPSLGQDILTSDPITLNCGGSAGNCSLHLASLAESYQKKEFKDNLDVIFKEVNIYTALGKDAWGDKIREIYKAKNVNIKQVVTNRPTTTGVTTIMTSRDDHGFLTHRGSIGDMKLEDFSAEICNEIANHDHVHIAGLFNLQNLKNNLKHLLKTLKGLNSDLTISLDMNWDSEGKWKGSWMECLSFVDVFTPNEKEILNLTGENELEPAMKILSKSVPILVVTLGEHGVKCWINGKQERIEFNLKSKSVVCVDSVGAGDAFASSFLFHWLMTNKLGKFSPNAIEYALKCGMKAGSIAVQHK